MSAVWKALVSKHARVRFALYSSTQQHTGTAGKHMDQVLRRKEARRPISQCCGSELYIKVVPIQSFSVWDAIVSSISDAVQPVD